MLHFRNELQSFLTPKKYHRHKKKHGPPRELTALYGSFCIYCLIKCENVSEMDTGHSSNSLLHEQRPRFSASACESVGGDTTGYASLTLSISTLNGGTRCSPERSADGELFRSSSQNPCCITRISRSSWFVLTLSSLPSNNCHKAEVRLFYVTN